MKAYSNIHLAHFTHTALEQIPPLQSLQAISEYNQAIGQGVLLSYIWTALRALLRQLPPLFPEKKVS